MKQTCLLLFIGLCFCVTNAIAQKNKIETDRPSETQSTELTEKGYFQAEIGFRKEQERGSDYSLFHPRAQLKYGLSEHFELRAGVDSKTERNFSENEFKYGLQPVELGFKAKLTESHGALPATTFLAQVGIPNWASEDHQQEQLLPKLRLLFENKLTEKLKLAYNAGAEWQGDGEGPQWIYTLSPQVELSDKWEAFVETYATFQNGHAAKQLIDGGFAYYPHQNIKLDLWGGKGLSHEAPDYFVSAGVSFRLKH
jgi:hypothetical protein